MGYSDSVLIFDRSDNHAVQFESVTCVTQRSQVCATSHPGTKNKSITFR